MKRVGINLEDIAGAANLEHAFHSAAKGKRARKEVREFIDGQGLECLQDSLLCGEYWPQPMLSFTIHDPKKRLIHAPTFRDRVLHHALIQQVGPVLERTMVHHSYACRKGRGTQAAVLQAQRNIQRFPCYGQMDMKSYFDSINHEKLIEKLERFLKGDGLVLLKRIIHSYQVSSGIGLPIGALSSQYLANFYLTFADRFLTEKLKARAYVRYMDDIVFWGQSLSETRDNFLRTKEFINQDLLLEVKPNGVVNYSDHGLGFCGYRLYPGAIKLGKRRYRQYRKHLADGMKSYDNGEIGELGLQRNASALNGMVALCPKVGNFDVRKANQWYIK